MISTVQYLGDFAATEIEAVIERLDLQTSGFVDSNHIIEITAAIAGQFGAEPRGFHALVQAIYKGGGRCFKQPRTATTETAVHSAFQPLYKKGP